jgi:hypothetical protein
MSLAMVSSGLSDMYQLTRAGAGRIGVNGSRGAKPYRGRLLLTVLIAVTDLHGEEGLRESANRLSNPALAPGTWV